MTTITKLLVFLLLPAACFSQRSSVAELEKKYSDDNVFALQITGNILKFLDNDKTAIENPDIREFIKKVASLHILAVSNQSKGYSSRDIKKLKRDIRKQNFEELISVKSDNGQLQLLVKDRQGKPSEIVLILDKDADGFFTLNYKANE